MDTRASDRDAEPLGRDDHTVVQILDGSPIGVFVVDSSGAPTYANDAAIVLLGCQVDPAAGTDGPPQFRAFVAGTDEPYRTSEMPIVRALSGVTAHVDDMEIHGPNGTRAVEVWGRPLGDDNGRTVSAVGVIADITERKHAEAALAERTAELTQLNGDLVRSNLELAEAQSIARIGSWEVDLVTNAVTWSRELYRVFGFGYGHDPSYEALIERTHPDDRDANVQAIRTALDQSIPFIVEHRLLFPDGTLKWIRARGRVEPDVTGVPGRLLGTAQDITEQKNAEALLLHQAFHDPLSGLPNRLLLRDRLQQLLSGLARRPAMVVLIYLDIDRFKVINDSLGHAVGDQLLLVVANRLANLVRPGDTLARVGGDEFVILCAGLVNEADAVGVAERMRAATAEPLAWEGGEIVISLSAGIAFATSDAVDADSLLRDADAALHRAKNQGRACSAVFVESMRTTAIGRLDTEISLRRSIGDGDLRLYYQPIVRLADGQTVGHEALVRWEHPSRGLLGPDQFIAVAEETGLIVPLGTWVLREACLKAKEFQQRDPRWSRLTMSVNISGVQLDQPDLIELIASALHDADLKSELLQLEMTESVLMDDAAKTITVLEALKGLGVRIGVDDFGTGFSSLAYLRRFPVDVLKIDRSFIDGLGNDLEDSAIVAAVVSLADALGLTVVAEGVETTLQRDCLVALGCARAQGYLFARPAPAADIEIALDIALRSVAHAPRE